MITNNSIVLNFWNIAAIVSAAVSVGVTLAAISRKRNRKDRQISINPYLVARKEKGRFASAFEDLVAYTPSFKENFHMDQESFNYIYDKVKPRLVHKRNTRPNICITPKEKVAMVLEYLASGTFQRHIASTYRVSKSTFGFIIDEVCNAISLEMGLECIPIFKKENWITTANKFNEKWNFPNCLGAIDGKHIAIRCPPKAGSLFYNYKKFHSIVLMALAEADYKFIYIDVGAYGSEGDAGVFASTSVGKKILRDSLELPDNAIVFSKPVPYFFVADDAFPLSNRIMKPYTPKRGTPLSDEQLIFNYRLSRARRCVENAFGVLSSKWLCLGRTMFCLPDKAQRIVTTCCILHNFLLTTSKESYCPPNLVDTYNADGTFIPGEWRKRPEVFADLSSGNGIFNRIIGNSSQIRDHLKNYVNSSQGEVEWQRRAVFL